MADTTVFVDEAVLGRFPDVCVKHGDPTEDWVVLSQPVGTTSLGVLWLLLLAGPIGILALLFVSASRSRDDILKIRLPCCEAITKRFNSARRSRWIAGLAFLLLSVLALVSKSHGSSGLWPYMTSLLVLGAVLALAEAIRDTLVGRRSTVGVQLDASRRWVTLKDVHQGFKTAVEADATTQHLASGNRRGHGSHR